jgi:hypothetical protein
MLRKSLSTSRMRIVLATLVIGLLSAAIVGSDDGEGKFEVTITNLTRGQTFSPPVVATQSYDLVPLFTLGSPASPELVGVAEDADNAPLVARLLADPKVKDVQVGTQPLGPGKSLAVMVKTEGKFDYVTAVGMLVTTNDAFFAANGVYGPLGGSTTHYSSAYDAGSEANNEICAFIPGPPCGIFFVRDPEGAEGYVHIHAGIHGIGDLPPAQFDWRNPVAKITIRRLSSGE